MINDFMKKKASKALVGNFITEEYKNVVIKKAELASSVGIDNENDLRKFHHISQLVPIFVRRATFNHNDKIISLVSSYVFEHADYNDNVDSVRDKVLEALSSLDNIIKIAYPQDVSIFDPIPTFNTQRWIKALNDINMKRRLFGISKESAIIAETKGWTEMEINKFKDWVNFYEQGGHLVYKTAQTFTTDSGISVPFNNSNNNVVKMAPIPGLMEQNKEDDFEAEMIQRKLEQKKIDQAEAFKKIRSSVIGRISSAKKLLSSEIGRNFVGEEYEKLLTSLLQLEKDILVLKNDKMLLDVVARAEASLIAQGHSDVAFMLVKIAQDNPFGDAPPPPDGQPPEEDGKSVKQDLIDTLNETSANPSKNEHPDNEALRAEVEKERAEKEAEEDKKKEPPAEPATPPASPAASPAPPPEAEATPQATAAYNWANYRTAELKNFEIVCETIENISKSTRQIFKLAQMRTPGAGSVATKYFEEDALDKAFANIKLSDVIRRMQALSKVFKNREIARQLSIIDLMLDKLGIAGLFPQLAEATKSALESNQYSSIRIEEVLSKLMSVMDENGNVDIKIEQSTQEPSLIDKEMEQAFKQPNLLLPNEKVEVPDQEIIQTAPTTKPILSPGLQQNFPPKPIAPTPVAPQIPTKPIAI